MVVLVASGKAKLPLVCKAKKPVSDLVIGLLSEEWPLSTRGLLLRIRHKCGREVSFQAVHKAVRKLYSEEVLARRGRCYSLNRQWLSQTESFLSGVRQQYESTEIRLMDMP